MVNYYNYIVYELLVGIGWLYGSFLGKFDGNSSHQCGVKRG